MQNTVFQKLLHGKPKYMWDCFVENKCLYGPLAKNKTGLIDTATDIILIQFQKQKKIGS